MAYHIVYLYASLFEDLFTFLHVLSSYPFLQEFLAWIQKECSPMKPLPEEARQSLEQLLRNLQAGQGNGNQRVDLVERLKTYHKEGFDVRLYVSAVNGMAFLRKYEALLQSYLPNARNVLRLSRDGYRIEYDFP